MLKRIQYTSDIHLEFHKNMYPKIRAIAPILCLGGDIGYPNMDNYKKFLVHLNSNNCFKKIFIIAGNHEYYNQNKSIEETNLCIEKITHPLPKISFLNNKSEFYDGYLFIGSTLWSKVHKSDKLINDFFSIQGMDIDKYNSLHNNAFTFIKSEIESNSDKKIVVLTHHLPSYSLINEKYKHYAEYNQYFASSSDELIKPPVVAWFYGHTHFASKSFINNVIVTCNPIGYSRENKNANFNEFIEI
jgi:predicted MPP superfamily phosphohydrolase